MMKMEIDYSMFLSNYKMGALLVGKNQSSVELICDRCGRKIKNYYSETYILRDYNNKICAYCAYEDMLQEVGDLISEVNSLNMNQGNRLEDYTEEMQNKIAFYRLLQNINKDGNKEGIYDYNEEDPIEINRIKIFSFCKSPLKLGFIHSLIGIKTNNNCAIVNGDTSYDPKFNWFNYANPFIFYYFSKEIYEEFNNLVEFEDYLYKLISCKVLMKWEESEDYNVEIQKLTEEIKKKFNNRFDFDTYLSIDKYAFNNKIKSIIFEELDTMLTDLYNTNTYNKEEKVILIDKIFALLKSIKDGIYVYEGIEYDLRSMYILDNYTLYNYLENSTTLGYQLHINKLYFEAWKVKDDDKYLFDCLERIDSFLRTQYSNIPDDKIYSHESDSKVVNLLEKIVYSFVEFYNVNENSFQNLAINGTLPKLNDSLYPSFCVPFFEPNENGELKEEHLAIIGANIAEILRLVYLILILLEIKLEGTVSGNENSYKVTKLIRSLKTRFMPPFQEYMNSIYKSRVKFENLNKELVSGVVYILNSFTEYISNLDINSLESYKRVFEFKHKNLNIEIPEELSESIDIAIFNLVKVIVEKTSSRDDEIYKLVKQNLINELGDKYNTISGSVFKTLSTAEYLYKLFENDDSCPLDIDYSCISIMYYKALEDLLNQKIYIPYKDNYLRRFSYRYKKNLGYIYKTYRNDCFDTIEDVGKYLPSNNNVFYKDGYIQDTLTLGAFAKFLEKISTLDKLKEFFKITLKDGIDIEKDIINYSNKLNTVYSRRNKSAHGGKIITHSDLKQDKSNVYTDEISKGIEYKILLKNLLAMLK